MRIASSNSTKTMRQAIGASGSNTQPERVPVEIFDNPGALARQAAGRIAELIRARQAAGEQFVLGLPSGSTPIGVYQELIRMHREEGLTFPGWPRSASTNIIPSSRTAYRVTTGSCGKIFSTT